MTEEELKSTILVRHKKGDLYYVEGVGKHTETGEKFVIYFKVHGDDKTIWIRPLDMFLDGRFTKENLRRDK